MVYGMLPESEPFRFMNKLKPMIVKEGEKVIFEVELSHNKEVTWLRGRGRCVVGSHYEIVAVGLRRTLIIKGEIIFLRNYMKSISVEGGLIFVTLFFNGWYIL